MQPFEQIAAAVKSSGYRSTIGAPGPNYGDTVVIDLGPSEAGAPRSLVVSQLQLEDDDYVARLLFRHIVPSQLEEPEALDELVRSLFYLNRVLPIGSYVFCESTPAVFFTYTLTYPRDALSDAVIDDTVGLIDYLTHWHGDLITAVMEGNADSFAVMDSLAENQSVPGPILFQPKETAGTQYEH